MLGMSLLMACRGIGAIVGPVVSGYLAAGIEWRMRLGILFGYVAGAAGYLMLGHAPGIGMACAGIILAHAGASSTWVFSSTLLQLQTEDRFRGRVFSAESALNVLTLSLSSYAAGLLMDRNVAPATVASATGLAVLIPAVLWGITLVRPVSDRPSASQ
jgi:MFS family permease